MKLNDLSINKKIAIPILGVIALGILVTSFVTSMATRKIVLDDVRNTTLPAYRDTVLNALTTLMVTGCMKDGKRPFLDQMSHIAEVKVLRSEALDKDFGKARPEDYPQSDIEREVLATGAEKTITDGDHLRGYFPYVAKSDSMGKDCLSCHKVPEGTALGVISIDVPLSASFTAIRNQQYLYFGLGLLGIAAISVLVLLITGRTLKPLGLAVEKIDLLSAGDLRVEIEASSKDEIGVLAHSMNRMIGSYNGMITSIMSAVGDVVAAVDIMRSRAEQTSEGARNQSGQAHQIAAASEEMHQTIVDIARNATTASESSADAMEIAESGKQITDIAVETIQEVNSASTELATMVRTLDGRVLEIGSILTLIRDVADQTNLLALNAAIEAARAGEQGRGFAVVADEVRKLAEKTLKATAEVSDKISRVQQDSVETMAAMEKSTKGVTKATGHIQNLNNVLQAIVESIQKVSDEITQIAAAVDQQSQASEEVTANIERSSLISKDMEGMSDDVLREVNSLVQIAEELRNCTAGFKTKGG